MRPATIFSLCNCQTPAFIIQAADYVANGLYANYEYNNDIYENIISKKINIVQHFPYKNFGK